MVMVTMIIIIITTKNNKNINASLVDYINAKFV